LKGTGKMRVKLDWSEWEEKRLLVLAFLTLVTTHPLPTHCTSWMASWGFTYIAMTCIAQQLGAGWLLHSEKKSNQVRKIVAVLHEDFSLTPSGWWQPHGCCI
jgi:hypothetical protein